jgi:catechol 2,3-dioxygenase-like lactoylglutathione lyase family enzyme
MRLNQITVGAIDFEKSVAFYKALGLRLIVSARGEYARFELPEGDATFSIHLQDAVPPGGPLLYLEVDDVDMTTNRLKGEGVDFVTDPEDQPWLWREARLVDPAGNRLCIFHAGENRRNPPWRIQDV